MVFKKGVSIFLAAMILVVSAAAFAVPTRVFAATVITDCTGLQNISGDLDGDYVLGNDIDCSGVADWSPLGTFTGKLDGAGFAIQHLTILGLTNGNAFFGNLDGAKIYNLSFTDANVQTNFVGGVLATTAVNQTKIVNVHVQGQIFSGALISITGALIGSIDNSDIYYSSSNVDVIGFQILGGLVGSANNGSSISNSFATGTVSSGDNGEDISIGGLVGGINDSTISNSYSQSDLSYDASNSVAGGLVGASGVDSYILNSYSSGVVPNGASSIGGLVGSKHASATTEHGYWDTDNSGQVTSDGGTGKTTLQMYEPSTFTGWSSSIWDMNPGQYPQLWPYDDTPPVLTQIHQVSSRVTQARIAYIFDGPGLEFGSQDYIMTPCGGISEPLVGENEDGQMEVHLQQAEVGQTYSCEIYTRNLTDLESNHLTIGPFKVIYTPSSGGSKAINYPVTESSPSIAQPVPLPPVVQIANAFFGPNNPLVNNLFIGLKDKNVKLLQQYLNSKGFVLASSGPGSPGNETELFGKLTREAVIRFQKANGIVPAVGYVGPLTRNVLNK